MILKELLSYFDIKENFPEYLLNQTFNVIFLEGTLSKKDNCYKIEVTTRQDVTHQMILKPEEEYPVVIMSYLPNGSLNGMKFGIANEDILYINEL